MTKDEILKGLRYCYNRPPSQWDIVFVTRFKTNLLSEIIEYIDGKQRSDGSKKNISTQEHLDMDTTKTEEVEEDPQDPELWAKQNF